MAAYQPDGRNRVARRQAEEARRFAITGDWERAATVNKQILEAFPRDLDAMNRLGKALMELGEMQEALDVYKQALEVEPANAIAMRNAGRLEQMVASRAAEDKPPEAFRSGNPVRASVFIEEVGKTYVTDLVRPAIDPILTQLAPADEVELRIEDKQVHVYDESGNRLGQLEPKIAQRLIGLIEDGNRFQAFIVALTGVTARIILREVYHNPDAPQKVAFPRQATVAAPRPYLRDTRRLTRELEPDLLLDSDDDEDEEETEDEEEIEGIESEEDDSDDEEYAGVTEEEDEEEDEAPLGG